MILLDLIKLRKKIAQIDEISRLKSELDKLKNIVTELRDDMQHIQEVNAETQKTNMLLYPQNFDKDKNDGKTVFVKNGEEKPYDTIDWRSR